MARDRGGKVVSIYGGRDLSMYSTSSNDAPDLLAKALCQSLQRLNGLT